MTPNIYQQLGLKKVINACGKMTILGVSSVAPEVMQATARAASAFVEIDALVEKAGARGSRDTGAEGSYLTAGAAAGVARAVGAGG
ncbi:SelA-like pyridoxal phosphate-dependent enzyme, partial [Salmonella enterica subsp. enterica serovar Wilhelmsburg]